MDIDDIVGVIGQFFSPRELFLYSRVSPIWNKNLIYHKKKIVKKIRCDTRRAHFLSNMCPCAIESVWAWADAKMRGVLVKNFKLVRHACSELNENEEPPEWFSKL